jgi:hypothetical protein
MHYLHKGIRALILLSLAGVGQANQGKLLGTSGLFQVEGSGGGGIVPWATLSGYDTQDQLSVSGFVTQVDLDDYRLNSLGVSLGIKDRIELSASQQIFDLKSLGGEIRQNILGIKARLYGDVIYSTLPQMAVGIQYKHLEDGDIAEALGADDNQSDVDVYFAATKVHLGLIGGYNTVWNTTIRATRGNEMGLLGYGGIEDDDYELLFEGSVGLLLSRQVAIGFEYRQKPDKLGLKEDDWRDVFVAYMPSKAFHITAAYADLGSIAGSEDQSGLYISFSGNLW